MTRLKCEFDGFDEVVARLLKLQGDVERATENALMEVHERVTEKAEKAIKKHRETGVTESNLRKQGKVIWNGTVAEVQTGFDIKNGGLPSIFLMYGTKVYGTPRTKKDQALYNAFFGKNTEKEIHRICEDSFYSAIRKAER